MQENSTHPFQPVLFFISKSLILAGMVLVFTILFSFIGALAAYFVYGVNIALDPGIVNEMETNVQARNALKLMQAFASAGGFIVPAWLFSKALNKEPRVVLMTGNSFSPVLLLISIALLFASAPFTSWLVEFNEHIKLPPSMADLEMKLKLAEESAARLAKGFTMADSFSGLLANLLIVAVIPALGEELLFRGALMHFLGMCFKNKHTAVIFSAILFSLFHGQFYGFLPRFTLGLMLGYIVLGTGSIWPAVIVHFINNAIITIATYYKWEEAGPEIMRQDYVFPVYINILSFIASAGIVYLLIREWKKRIFPNGE